MSHIEPNYKYTDSHEWVLLEGNTATIGITDHAQELLGDLVYVELPEVGVDVAAGDEAGVVESVKAASDVYSPVTGKIVEINESLEGSPELVNANPYTEGWLYRVEISDASEVEAMMSAEAYEGCIEE